MSDNTSDDYLVEKLQKTLGYQFKDPTLLITALTHASRVRDTEQAHLHNQRLEFLGDAVLSLILAETLYHALPDQREGKLTNARSALVRGDHLSQIARKLQLDQYLRLGEHETKAGIAQRPSLLEDAFEALIAALYLDAGLDTTRRITLNLYGNLTKHLDDTLEDHNPKGRLQELIQASSPDTTIAYEIITTEGPPHERTYTSQVLINGKTQGQGTGRSKKEAEEAAARIALEQLDPQ